MLQYCKKLNLYIKLVPEAENIFVIIYRLPSPIKVNCY